MQSFFAGENLVDPGVPAASQPREAFFQPDHDKAEDWCTWAFAVARTMDAQSDEDLIRAGLVLIMNGGAFAKDGEALLDVVIARRVAA
jgi:hypothetical protein